LNGTPKFGNKFSNLSRLPEPWVPIHFGIDLTEENFLNTEFLASIRTLNDDLGKVIIRSSGGMERLHDRGSLPSYVINRDKDDLRKALTDIRRACLNAGQSPNAVCQAYKKPDLIGHLSNERRVSSTRNQWEVEFEGDVRNPLRCNSQRDEPQSDLTAIRVSATASDSM